MKSTPSTIGILCLALILLAVPFMPACAKSAPKPAPSPPPAPAAFEVSKLTITPAEAYRGDKVTVTAEVSNTGDTEGSYTVELRVNDALIGRETLTVAARSSRIVTFVVSPDTVGTHKITVDGNSKELIVKPRVVRVEDSDPSFVYSPGWKSEQNPGASGGSWVLTHYGAQGYTDIKVDIKFKGTAISLVHLVAPFGGIANITIDGKNYPSIDMYGPMVELKTTIIATDLADTDHTLTISPSKHSNPAVSLPAVGPTRPVIVIDAVEITVP